MRILLTLLIMTSNCYAGVDFTMGFTGNSGDSAMNTYYGRSRIISIPEFDSKAEVFKWVNQIGYSEPVRRAVRNRADWYRDLTYLGSDPTHYQVQMARYYAWNRELLEYGLKILENMRAHGMKADPSMIITPDFPSRQYAVAWANMQHDKFLEIRESIQRRMIELTRDYWKHYDNFRGGLIEAQMERQEAALKVIENKLMVGAYVVASSIPMIGGLSVK